MVAVPVEIGERSVELGDERKKAQPELQLLERAGEALGLTITIGRGHEDRARLEAEKVNLAQKCRGRVDTAVTVV